MRKLLSLLSVLTIGTVATTNVVACGGKSTGNGSGGENHDSPTVDDNKQDVGKLLELVGTIIKEQFQKIVDKDRNLLTDRSFDDGDVVKDDLTKAEVKKEVDSTAVKNNYFNLITSIINSDIIPTLQENEKLKQLFYGIDVSQILKLDTTGSSVVKDEFDYSALDGRFNISKFDPNDYTIKYWFKLDFKLSLNLSYVDLDGNLLTKDYDNNPTFYFANNDADIEGVMYAAGQKIDEKIPQSYVIETTSQDIDEIKEQALADITKKIDDSKVIIDDLLVNTTNLGYVTEYNTVIRDVVTADQTSTAITNLNKELTKSLDVYLTKLNSWIADKDITSPKNKIFKHGTITISNWNVFGLTLKSKQVSVVSLNKKINQRQWVTQNAALYGKLWNQHGLLKNMMSTSGGNVTFKMNPADFDKIVNKGLQTSDAVEIITNYLTDFAIKAKLIDKSEKLAIDFNNWNPKNQFVLNDKKINETTIKLDANDFVGYMRINLASEGFYATFATQSGGGYTYSYLNNIYLTRADSNVWPTT